MPIDLTITNPWRYTAYDSVDGLNDHPDAVPCSGSSSDSSRLTARAIAPFKQLERQYADLFSSREIQEVNTPPASIMEGKKVKDIDLDECEVINASRDNFDYIGTSGLSKCIGICARGLNSRNETIMGVCHYTGVRSEPAAALQLLRSKMDEKGAGNAKMYLVGGAMSADPDLGSLSAERELLSLRQQFNIKGVRLHTSIWEDIYSGEYVNLLMTPDNIYFSTEPLYSDGEGDDSDTGSSSFSDTPDTKRARN
ncbi:hypothetical protein Bresa_03501|uniref:Uncharacterized protein n=1 Tax=Brenneria salicis ATCC 15712 = DSM 30166 TaxID=714314 RepID=A0A366IA05_9GAMM|nr:XopAK family type III secretion system effector [Brenneria salicis]NMN93111.1 hypothetical protein [Brenneria salicis ATCC 15712 = DSM 30166]RBP65190.1 hypothetical protein DES54_10566 [Brenneria salicis ATCC 15712 = DSM 30166]RLM31691.1 hypothetical protein BHG07_04030 [Brenneria salicis ATCC 15712 = DSM 30166]